jgi:hypothetical protein
MQFLNKNWFAALMLFANAAFAATDVFLGTIGFMSMLSALMCGALVCQLYYSPLLDRYEALVARILGELDKAAQRVRKI